MNTCNSLCKYISANAVYSNGSYIRQILRTNYTWNIISFEAMIHTHILDRVLTKLPYLHLQYLLYYSDAVSRSCVACHGQLNCLFNDWQQRQHQSSRHRVSILDLAFLSWRHHEFEICVICYVNRHGNQNVALNRWLKFLLFLTREHSH